jgi:hypothetical protein
LTQLTAMTALLIITFLKRALEFPGKDLMPDRTKIGYLPMSIPQVMAPATPTVLMTSLTARRPRNRCPRHQSSGEGFAGNRRRSRLGGTAETATR